MSAEDYGDININLIQFESIIIKYSNKPLEFNPSPLRLELLCLSELADWSNSYTETCIFRTLIFSKKRKNTKVRQGKDIRTSVLAGR